MKDSTKRYLKPIVTAVVGGGVATATFFLSDFALPNGTQWWVHWAMAAASLVSYALGAGATIMTLRERESDALKAANARIAELERKVAARDEAIVARDEAIAGKDAAIRRQKERNAELAARWDDHERREREAARTRVLLNLPRNLLPIVRKAYDEGYYEANWYDQEAQSLLGMGILGSPPIVSQLGLNKFMLQPSWAARVGQHYGELFEEG